MNLIPLPDDLRPGRVVLRVEDLDRVNGFYRRVLGLRRRSIEDGPDGAVGWGTETGTLVELRGGGVPPEDEPRPRAGLYHLALRVPSRSDLGRMLRRFRRSGWPLRGGADHGVSEAIYMSDPEGNGIEIYADRPPDEWPRRGNRIAMGSDPLDVDDLLAAGASSASAEAAVREEPVPEQIPSGTRMGHVHLRVTDLRDAEGFYADELGLRVTQRSYPGALFFAVGDYHHHVGTNVWGEVAPVPDDPSVTGLVEFELLVDAEDGAIDEELVHDPDGLAIRIRSTPADVQSTDSAPQA